MTEKTTWLPSILFDLNQLFGARITLRFSAEFGGRHLYVPQEASADHRIAQTVGLNVMEWLVENYGGEYTLIPLGDHSSYTKRVNHVRRMVAEGETLGTITRVVHCHERTVFRHRAKVKSPDKDQGDLF